MGKIARLEFNTLILVMGLVLYSMFRINLLFEHKYKIKKHYVFITISILGVLLMLLLKNQKFEYKFIAILIIYITTTLIVYKNTIEEKFLYLAYVFLNIFIINVLLISLIMQLSSLQNKVGMLVTMYCRTLQWVLFVLIYIITDICLLKYWINGYFFQFVVGKSKRILVNLCILGVILGAIVGIIFVEFFVLGKSKVFFQYPIIIFLIICLFLIFIKINVDSSEFSNYKANKHLEFQAMAKSLELINNIDRDRRIIHHDTKHHFSVIKYLLDNGDINEARKYLNTLVEKVNDIDRKRICRNNVVNGILILKSDICERENIDLGIDIKMREESRIDAYDLVKIFSNIIDNAIESNIKIEARDRRFINLYVVEEDNYLSLNLQNASSFSKNVSVAKTTKKDKHNHGVGIKSIKKAIKKYDGTIEFKNENYVFSVRAYIPLER